MLEPVRVIFTKWGELPHWEFDCIALGEDEHGSWLGLLDGTRLARPGVETTASGHQVLLVSSADRACASFHSDRIRVFCEVYVDIVTAPVWHDGSVRLVDLDLDVIRDWSGRVWVDDEDEFAEHRVRFGYPDEVVEDALAATASIERKLTDLEPPYDEHTPLAWAEVFRRARG